MRRRLVKDAGGDVRRSAHDARVNLLDVLLLDISNVGHQVRHAALAVRQLTLDVVLSEHVVDALEHTRLVQVNVAETDYVVANDGLEVHLGEVDSAERSTKVDVAHESRADLGANSALGLLGRATDVRRQDDVGRSTEVWCEAVEGLVKELAVLCWLLGVHVDGGTCKLARLESASNSLEINDGTTRVVEQVTALLHVGYLLSANHVDGFRDLRDVEGDKVGFLQELLEGLGLVSRAEGHEGEDVVVEHMHAHGLGKHGKLGADVTIANDAKGLVADLPAALGDLIPFAAAHLVGAVSELS